MRRKTAVLGIALALAATAVACSGDDGSSGGAGEADEADPATSVVEGEAGVMTEVTAELAQIAIAGVLSVTAGEPVRLDVEATSADHAVDVPPTTTARVRQEVPVVGLRAETTYEITVAALDEAGAVVDQATTELTTGALPAWIPPITLDASDPARMEPGVTLFDIQRWGVTPPAGEPPGMLVAVDEEGQVVWYWGNDLGAGDARMTAEGTIFVLYAPFGFRELDLLGRRIQSWTWGDENTPERPRQVIVQSPQYQLVNFHHEVAPQPDGDLIVFSRYQLDLSPEEQEAICPGDPVDFGLREDLVMEITREGEVLNEWSLSDILDPAEVPGRELCAVDFEDYRDWAHGNGIVLDEANNRVLVTARHIDSFFAFRYRDDEDGPSGELLWNIAPDGTIPLDGEPSYGLHAPELTEDGSFLIFDNGNERPGGEAPYSRLVRYVVDDSSEDPADWTARQTWEFRTDDLVTGGPLYADFLGDADELANGNVLGGFGGIGQVVPPARGRIIEVVPTGEAGGDIVWDISIPDTYVSYRAQRLTSLYAGPRWDTDFIPPLVS